MEIKENEITNKQALKVILQYNAPTPILVSIY